MAGKCTCTPYDHCRGRPKFKAKPCPCVKCKQKRYDEDTAKQSYKAQLCLGSKGRTALDGLRGPVGISYFANEKLNFIATILLEALGILVFFAIATLTFWVSVCYYAIKIAVAVKRADRSHQLAAGIVACLIMLAFAVNLVTKKDCKTCPSKSRKPSPSFLVRGTHTKCGAGKQVQKTTTAKCKMRPKPVPPKKCSHKSACPKKSNCAAKMSFSPLAAARRNQQRIYTDCEGRRIFQNSRRYAIPMEMKQPPAFIIYVRDWLCSLVNRG